MNMDLKTLLPIAAILISLLSLGVSVWNTRFSRRAKLSELRTTVLIKALEISSRVARIQSLNAQVRAHAEKLKDFDTYKITEIYSLDVAQKKWDGIYKKISALPTKHSLEIYEKLFHEICEINEQTISTENIAQKNHDLYVNQKQLPPGPA